MKVADMHCDTISELFAAREQGSEETLLENSRMIDLKKLRKGDYLIQNFALYSNLGRTEKGPFWDCMGQADLFFQELERWSQWVSPVCSYGDIERNAREGKLSAMLTIEEGEACQGELAFLRNFYRLGVRMMTLTWNYPNQLAYPNRREADGQGKMQTCQETERGLTEKGFAFLEEMERLGMIIDISHLGDRGIWQVFAHTSRPLVASHSNAREVANHPRNLSDQMIRTLSERGGVMGINFFGLFLNAEQPEEKIQSRVEDMIAHMKHIRSVGGIQCLGLGTDFDGIYGELELRDASHLPRLAQAMEKAGFTTGEIEAVFYKNVLRVYREVLK